ncbi:hypothetical protein [Saccharothrix xinjiangensis]|uniref:DUF3558 domain-containing protein n=1 Tax=Saccharothrix xinjiangensis TaxID=204798 RepID=A0ABV9XXV3_9PSEU
MFRRLAAVPLPLLGAALLLSACTSGGDASSPADTGRPPATPAVEQAVPEKYRPTAQAFAKFRSIDACALHDIAAAQQVTGDQGDEIVPGRDGLHQCVLRLHKSEFESTWTFTVEVGALFESQRRRDAAPETLAGMEMFIREDDHGCTVSKALDDTHAIEMRTGSVTDAPRRPCDVLREYVSKLAPLWTDPPARDSGATSPRLSLAGIDPCVTAAAVLDDAGAGAELRPRDVFGCTVIPAHEAKTAPSKTRTDIEVVFTLDEDPAALVTSGQGARGITVGGLRAVIHERATGCAAYVVWDPDTTVVVDRQSEDALPSYQVIRVQAGTCDTARSAAEKVVAKVGSR